MTVAIIDSGVDFNNLVFYGKHSSFEVTINGNVESVQEDFNKDSIGHGTEVASIIVRETKVDEIISFAIFNDEFEIGLDRLIATLKYINDNSDSLNIDYINISLGITYLSCDEYYMFKRTCESIRQKGMVIISAFDNDGAISYPAAFDSVVGVDIDYTKPYFSEPTCNDYSIVNIEVPNRFYRIHGKNNLAKIVRGTSFACAYATAFLINKGENECDSSNHLMHKSFNIAIKEAIIIHYCKEADVLLRNADLLNFRLTRVFDTGKTGNVGKKVNEFVIESLDKINWNDKFDTVILSCIDKLRQIMSYDIREEIIQQATKHNKVIYSFENIDCLCHSTNSYFYPRIGKEDFPVRNNDKLRLINIPVICVLGTSSNQGKYTVLLDLLRRFKIDKYNVGVVSTEPSGYLFGADAVFPMGYNSTVELEHDLYKYIAILNEAIWDCQLRGREVVLTSCQSGTINYDICNLNQFAVNQYGFIQGVQPDAVVLVVNFWDEIEYITRTISFIRSLSNLQRIIIILNTRVVKKTIGGIQYGEGYLNGEDIDEKVTELRGKYCVNVYKINDIENVYNELIGGFSNE